MTTHPIVVFDSGVGGLTVLNKLVVMFPRQPFLYFGDTVNMPYGNKDQEDLQALLDEQFNKIIEKFSPKAIVIACNTASAVYQLSQKSYSVPVIGIISPFLKHFKIAPQQKLAVLATPLTVSSGYYAQEIKQCFSDLPEEQLELFSGGNLAQLIEAGLSECDKTLIDVLKDVLSPVVAWQPDLLVLGCTHYPLIKVAIQKYLPSVQLIDPADYLKTPLTECIEPAEKFLDTKVRYYVSGDVAYFADIASSFVLQNLMIFGVQKFN